MKKIFKAIVSGCFVATAGLLITSCGGNDDITGTLKLERTATESKTFIDNGIEECEVVSYTDGDTTTIRTKYSKKTMAIRYLSIDTPESTARYEKWGKAASKFNEETLSKATSIIVEAEGSSATKDTTSSGRYLGYIWYKTADSDTYRNLNLEIVENGYSPNNCGVEGKYYKYFEKAEKKAEKNKLHIHSDASTVDIYYSEEINKVTIKDLNENDYYDKTTDIPTCVQFDAYVTGVSGSSFLTATVENYDSTTKKYYTYSVVIGYDTNLAAIVKTGNYVKFVGWTTGEKSVHGCTTNITMPTGSPLYTTLKTKKYYNNLKDVVVTSVEVLPNGVVLFKGTKNNTEIILVLNDDTITQETAQRYVKTYKSIKCFKTDTGNSYTINTLNDLNFLSY